MEDLCCPDCGNTAYIVEHNADYSFIVIVCSTCNDEREQEETRD
jgi:hypothetical protein